jgi:hypothetical protein
MIVKFILIKEKEQVKDTFNPLSSVRSTEEKSIYSIAVAPYSNDLLLKEIMCKQVFSCVIQKPEVIIDYISGTHSSQHYGENKK